MKVYIGKDMRGILKASLNLDTIMKYSFDGNIQSGYVNTIHNGKIYMIHVYYGYDYVDQIGEWIDVINDVGPFHSVTSAVNSESWQTLEMVARHSDHRFINKRGIISAVNADGSLYTRGDIRKDLFNAKIIGVQLI